jgi:copper chaperone
MTAFKFKTNINCSNCIRTVSPFLNALDSIDEWKVDTDDPDKILTAEGDGLILEDVEAAVKKAGFNVQLLSF